MIKRQPIPSDLRDELLFQSGRRCCICYGLKHDTSVTLYGQIIHLNRNPADNRPDNLAYLCLDHYDLYASGTQSASLTMGEVKRYRQALYEEIGRVRRRGIWPDGIQAPYLNFTHAISPESSVNGKGIQFTDTDTAQNQPVQLYLAFHFNATPTSDLDLTPPKAKWLTIEATLSPGLRLRIQVRAWSQEDAKEFLHFLREGGSGYNLHGARPKCDDSHTGDYFHVWQENGEYQATLSTFTATNASMSIHARLSPQTVQALADYLEEAGFGNGS